MGRAPGDVMPVASTTDFDDLCWDIYPRVTARYQSEPDFVEHRAVILHAIEEGFGDIDTDQALHLEDRRRYIGGSLRASPAQEPP